MVLTVSLQVLRLLSKERICSLEKQEKVHPDLDRHSLPRHIVTEFGVQNSRTFTIIILEQKRILQNAVSQQYERFHKGS